jgi:hypothetical protein
LAVTTKKFEGVGLSFWQLQQKNLRAWTYLLAVVTTKKFEGVVVVVRILVSGGKYLLWIFLIFPYSFPIYFVCVCV